MTFAHPLWFLGFLLLPALIALQVWSDLRRRELLRKLVALRLQPALASTASPEKRWFRLLLLLIGLAFLFITLAQPRWGENVITEKVHGRDIIFIVDTSRSMLATDLAPNRLTRVKLAAEDLVGDLKGDRIGLVAFAGTAFLQAPLTADTSAVLTALHELDTNIIPRGGTNIAEAIHTAVDAFGKGESLERAIVLFTDGEELDADGLEAARELKGIRIFTVGAGSPEGTIVPLPGSPDGSPYLKDPDGQIVKTRLDEERLRAIAEATGGFYIPLRSGPAEMKQILAGLMQLSAYDSDNQVSRRPIERYQWPLSAALLFLAGSLFIGERRRILPPLGTLAALALLLAPRPAVASNPGLESYAKKDYAGAIEHFEKKLGKLPDSAALQYDVGTAAYKAGQFDKALGAFSEAIRARDPGLRVKAEYNLGNTLFQRGAAQKENDPKIKDWRNSLQHYEQALRLDPKNADAAYNESVVRKLLGDAEQQKKEEEEKKKQEQKNGEGKKDEKKGEQEKKDGQKGEGEPKKDGEGEKKNGQSGKPEEGGEDQADREKKEGKEAGEPDEDGEKKAAKKGEIESTEKGKEEQARKEAEQAAEEQAAAESGRMTASQARVLLDSLKNEDDRIQLLNPKTRGGRDRNIRDW